MLNKRSGWRGKLFHSANTTFVCWEFDEGAGIHRHDHEQEEVWRVVEGELEVAIAGKARRCRPGTAAVIPPNTAHSVQVIRPGRAIVVDHPLREGF